MTESAKQLLHDDLQAVRDSMLARLDGLLEYDLRRPITATGTNLLGLIKHLSAWEARYLGEVFDRPFPEPMPRWDDPARFGDDLWVTEEETSEEIVAMFRRVGEHSDETIRSLDLDAQGHVPWWPRPDVTLFNILIHLLSETNRHAGHADILREQIDGTTGFRTQDSSTFDRDRAFWKDRVAMIEQAAKAASSRY